MRRTWRAKRVGGAVQVVAILSVQSDVANVGRADIYVDGRPRASVDIAGSSAVVTVAGSAGAGTVRVEG